MDSHLHNSNKLANSEPASAFARKHNQNPRQEQIHFPNDDQHLNLRGPAANGRDDGNYYQRGGEPEQNIFVNSAQKMDPTFAQNLVAAILDKHAPQSLNQTVKNSHMSSSGWARATTNRTIHKQGKGALRDAIAKDNMHNGQSNLSPTKSTQNFIEKNKQLCSSARNLKGNNEVSANKADIFIAASQRHKEIKTKDLQLDFGLDGIQTGKRNVGVVVGGVYGERNEQSYNIKPDEEDAYTQNQAHFDQSGIVFGSGNPSDRGMFEPALMKTSELQNSFAQGTDQFLQYYQSSVLGGKALTQQRFQTVG